MANSSRRTTSSLLEDILHHGLDHSYPPSAPRPSTSHSSLYSCHFTHAWHRFPYTPFIDLPGTPSWPFHKRCCSMGICLDHRDSSCFRRTCSRPQRVSRLVGDIISEYYERFCRDRSTGSWFEGLSPRKRKYHILSMGA